MPRRLDTIIFSFNLCLSILCSHSDAFGSPHFYSKRTRVQTIKTTNKSAENAVNETPPANNGRHAIDGKALANLSSCKTGTCAKKVLYEALIFPNLATKNDGDDARTTANFNCTTSNPLFDSARIPPGATDRPISDAELALQTGIRGRKFKVTELIETNGDRDADRASIFLFCLMTASSGSAIVANQYLAALSGVPEIFRFVIVWVLSFAPLGFVGAGIAMPDFVQGPLISLQRFVFPSYRRRMLQHEAGHFLLAHLLGRPIQAYKANAIKNAVEFYPLADEDVGADKARLLGFDKRRSSPVERIDPVEDRPYFSEDGKGKDLHQRSVFRNKKDYRDNPILKLPSTNDSKSVWPYRGFDHKTLDELAVISLAGVCAEILGFGNAEGGVADLRQLQQLFSNAEPELTEKQMENRVRFAIGYGTSLLRRNLGALDALAEVMERDGTIEECVMAIETCENLSGSTALGGYEQHRKERLLGSNPLERLLVTGGKNADIVDDRREGKGGGERTPRFMNSENDDPFYAALAISAVFLVWAISGGLSLH